MKLDNLFRSLVSVQLFGPRGMSQEKELGSNIEAGSKRSYEVDDSDIGDVNKIIVKVTGNQGYRCKEIRIKRGNENNKVFQCLKALKACSQGGSQFYCQDELLPQGDSSYEITLKTSGEPESNTTSPILVGIIGEKGISNYQMFSETGCELNSQMTNIIKVKDVGKITGYQVRLAEYGKWRGAHMIIKSIKTGTVTQFDLKDVAIENPGKDFYKFDTSSKFIFNQATNPQNKGDSSGTASFSSGGFSKIFESAADLFSDSSENEEEEEDDEGLTELSEESSLTNTIFGSNAGSLDLGVSTGINPNDAYGGLLEQKEKKSNLN